MKRCLLFFVANLYFVSLYPQFRGKVVDVFTGKGISMATLSVEGRQKGVSADESGFFQFPNFNKKEVLLVSALGYESKKVKLIEGEMNTIELKPLTIDLNIVDIKPEKSKTILVGKFKKKSSYSYGLGSESTTYEIARFFPYKQHYRDTPYINRLRILARSDLKNAKFEVNFFDMDSTNCPAKPILDNWIEVRTRKGKAKIKIKPDSIIEFPREGVYVVIRLLKIEENKYEYVYTVEGSKKKHHGVSYEPSICMVPIDTIETFYSHYPKRSLFWLDQWHYQNRDWLSKMYQNKSIVPGIEIQLKN